MHQVRMVEPELPARHVDKGREAAASMVFVGSSRLHSEARILSGAPPSVVAFSEFPEPMAAGEGSLECGGRR